MGITFDNSSPIYLQLLIHFRKLIASSTWSPGSRIPSVRDLALSFGVNPNTVQRALADLERDGLAKSERTSGRFITEDLQLIMAMRERLADELVQDSIRHLSELGLSLDESVQLLSKKWMEKGKQSHD